MDVVEPQLPDARRVRDVGVLAERQANELGGPGGVPTLGAEIPQGPHLELQLRVDGVDQGALAHPAGPGHHGDLVLEQLLQLVDAPPFLGAAVDDRVADLLVEAEDRPGLLQAGQVHLVDADDGWQLVGLRDDQEAIQHAQMGLGLGHGEDHQHLVRVGQDHVLGRAADPRPLAAEHRMPVLHPVDEPLALPLRQDPDPIPHGHQGVLPLLLQQPPPHLTDPHALRRLHVVVMPPGSDHDARDESFRWLVGFASAAGRWSAVQKTLLQRRESFSRSSDGWARLCLAGVYQPARKLSIH